jgi:hypothetical protein
MAHFAKLNNNNIVIEVMVVNNNELYDEFGNQSEQKGIDFLTNWSGGHSNWKQTSYNTIGGVYYLPTPTHSYTVPPIPPLSSEGIPGPDQSLAFRGNYAGPGFIYDQANDVFYAPQPYPSWILNNITWTWEAPIPMPVDEKIYQWDEPTVSWIEIPSP